MDEFVVDWSAYPCAQTGWQNIDSTTYFRVAPACSPLLGFSRERWCYLFYQRTEAATLSRMYLTSFFLLLSALLRSSLIRVNGMMILHLLHVYFSFVVEAYYSFNYRLFALYDFIFAFMLSNSSMKLLSSSLSSNLLKMIPSFVFSLCNSIKCFCNC